jgi:hypothetical protein
MALSVITAHIAQGYAKLLTPLRMVINKEFQFHECKGKEKKWKSKMKGEKKATVVIFSHISFLFSLFFVTFARRKRSLFLNKT